VPAKEVSATAHAGRAAVLSDGRTVIAWKNPSGEVWLRIYDADLDAGSAPIRVNKAAYPASDAVDVEALADGRFVVAWGGTAPWSRTLLQMFTASGAPEGQMWMTGEAIRSVPAIAGSPDGGLIVTWQQGFIAFRRHSPSGMPTGATVVANRYGSGEQPAITPLEDGRFAIVWTGLPGHTIAAARFNADGTPAAP
jgi:hypothetical protein